MNELDQTGPALPTDPRPPAYVTPEPIGGDKWYARPEIAFGLAAVAVFVAIVALGMMLTSNGTDSTEIGAVAETTETRKEAAFAQGLREISLTLSSTYQTNESLVVDIADQFCGLADDADYDAQEFAAMAFLVWEGLDPVSRDLFNNSARDFGTFVRHGLTYRCPNSLALMNY